MCHLKGIGTRENPQEAFRLALAAADAGSPFAQLMVGDFYAYGTGTAQDKNKAERYYLLAATHGEPHARKRLGKLAGIPERHDILN